MTEEKCWFGSEFIPYFVYECRIRQGYWRFRGTSMKFETSLRARFIDQINFIRCWNEIRGRFLAQTQHYRWLDRPSPKLQWALARLKAAFRHLHRPRWWPGTPPRRQMCPKNLVMGWNRKRPLGNGRGKKEWQLAGDIAMHAKCIVIVQRHLLYKYWGSSPNKVHRCPTKNRRGPRCQPVQYFRSPLYRLWSQWTTKDFRTAHGPYHRETINCASRDRTEERRRLVNSLLHYGHNADTSASPGYLTAC